MVGHWTRDVASSSGQVFEFRLWSALVEQSRGRLHVFLPMSDRGVDAMVHRLSDGTYFRVQAKGRSSLIGGEVHLVVWAVALTDDDALLVGGLIVEGGLGPTMLTIPVREFKRLAEKTSADGEAVYSMSFGVRPREDSRWKPYLRSTEDLVAAFGISRQLEAALQEPSVEPRRSWRSDIGFLGEAEAIRLLAEIPGLNLFRPFPDLETVEVLALHPVTRRVLGLQVKTIEVDSAHRVGAVHVLASSFRASPTTCFAVFAWLREESRFYDECLLIPSEAIVGIAQPTKRSGHMKFDWRPDSSSPSRLDPYRCGLSSFGRTISGMLE